MNTQQDFEEFLRLLEKHDCDYVIVGGYAVAFYGYPRFTKEGMANNMSNSLDLQS